MYEKIKSLAKQYYPETVAIRRDLHKYPEQGWLEMRTASLVAKKLEKLGYQVLIGKEIMCEEYRMGVPDQEILESNYQRAISQGADPYYIKKVKDGFTAVAGILKNGSGPVVACVLKKMILLIIILVNLVLFHVIKVLCMLAVMMVM